MKSILPDHICCICGENANEGVTFINGDDDSRGFIYMKKNEEAHIECYIHKCVEMSLKELER
jgi:hypothetical protein